MKISEPKVSYREAQDYMGIRTQVSVKQMGSGVIPQLLGEVSTWLETQGVAPVGAPFIRFHVIDIQAGMDIEMGWPVQSPLAGNERIKAGVLPAGCYASLVYTGLRNGIQGN